ncbi:unnamed protein product, partial [Phaeothamnion confervicola]
MKQNQREIDIFSFAKVESTYAIMKELDSIFFEASSVRTFASEATRTDFRERWLGSYLVLNPEESFLAVTAAGEVAGYVVGDLRDPAANPRYSTLGYFRDFAQLTPAYPAHLHMNVASQHRSRGLGARLIATFAAHAQAAGVPGIHVVTPAATRTLGFYRRH